MGLAQSETIEEAELVVEFADPDRDIILGDRIPWSAELCEMPDFKEIPSLARPRRSSSLGGLYVDLDVLSEYEVNPHFYREMANFEAFGRCFRRLRLVVTNKGKVLARDVRIEISIPKGQGIGVPMMSEVPDPPKRKHSRFDIDQRFLNDIRPAHPAPGYVDIDSDNDRCKLEIECRNLQPGRKVWCDVFYMGIIQSGEYALCGHALASNLSQPKAFTLTIDGEIKETSMTVDELIDIANSRSDHEED